MSRTITLDLLRLDHPLWTNPRTVTGMSDAELDELGDDLLDRGQQFDITVQMAYDSPRTRAEWPKAAPLPTEPVVERDPGIEGDEIEGDDTEVAAEPMMEGDIGEPFALVLDGQRRVLAFIRACKRRKKGLRTVTVKVADYSEGAVEFTAAYAAKLFDNITAAAIRRKGLSSYEQLEATRKSIARGRTAADAGKVINRSESWVSRMLRAYDRAGPSLLELWKQGKVTDERFKDLADVQGGDELFPYRKQEIATQEALAIQATPGREGKTAARHLVKEAAAKAKAERKAAAASPKAEPKAKGKVKKAAPEPARKAPSERVSIQAIYALGQLHKPMDPYVKGVMACAAYTVGEINADQFASSFRSYLKRASRAGIGVPPGLGFTPPKAKRKK